MTNINASDALRTVSITFQIRAHIILMYTFLEIVMFFSPKVCWRTHTLYATHLIYLYIMMYVKNKPNLTKLTGSCLICSHILQLCTTHGMFIYDKPNIYILKDELDESDKICNCVWNEIHRNV